MAGIKRFEDIEAWKEARELTRQIYRATARGGFRKDFGLRDQIQRASVSIMANIAEGFDGGSDREFMKFLGYATRSSTELQSHLYVALDQEYMGQDTFASLYAQTVRVKNLTSGFIRYLRSRPKTLHVGR
jgi:four helix bundle protein